MIIIASLSINLQLTKPIHAQIANLELLMGELKARGISITSTSVSPVRSASVPDAVGENEAAWLAYSKRGRMNMKDKTLSREAQAKIYLEEKGLTVPNPDCEVTHEEKESIQDFSHDDSDDEDHDPFIPKM